MNRNERIDAYLRQNLKNSTQRMQREFAFFCANLHNFLPQIPVYEYVTLFNRLQANRMLADLDIEHASIIQVHGWDETYVAKLVQRPGIICTFHTGSYRFLSLLLSKARIPISLVVAGDALKQEQHIFENRFAPAAYKLGIRPNVDFINATLPNSLIRMTRAAKQGRCLLVYVDGNTGAGTSDGKQTNLLALPFCAQQVRVRKGTPLLAYRLGLPLYPISGTRGFINMGTEGSHRLFFKQHQPILPSPEENEHTYVARATQRLYRILQEVASTSPYEWEGWLNVHSNLVLSPAATDASSLEINECIPFHWGKYAFLLHLPTYTSYQISETKYTHIWRHLDNKS